MTLLRVHKDVMLLKESCTLLYSPYKALKFAAIILWLTFYCLTEIVSCLQLVPTVVLPYRNCELSAAISDSCTALQKL